MEGVNVFAGLFAGPPGAGLPSATLRIVNNRFSGNNGGAGPELVARFDPHVAHGFSRGSAFRPPTRPPIRG